MAYVLLLFHVLGFISSVHAVMTNRTAQGAIAWGVSLNTFPYLAVPFYWVFGRQQFEGYVEARRKDEAEIAALVREVREPLEPYAVEVLDRIPDYEAMKALAGTPLLHHNSVELLIDGQATFDSILNGIGEAQDYVLVQFYIVRADGLGTRLKEALIAAAKRGARVFFVYDEIGSLSLPSAYVQELSQVGVEIYKFNTTQGRRNRFQLNFRNHRKIVVVDGRQAWIGGHNVGDEYLGLDPKVGPWRDTHIRLTGPVVQLAQATFLADWYWAAHTLPTFNWQPEAAEGDDRVMVVPISPASRLETAQLFFVHSLSAAKKRIWIATPYFVPDEAVMAALRLAALRGVDVGIIVPDKSDNRVVDLATLWFINELDGLGIRFYRYREGFLHQKVFLVDDDVSMVGTANFDNRSFRLQFEVNVLVVDTGFAAKMEQMLRADFDRSQPYDSAQLQKEPFFKRLAVSVARLTAPLL